MNTTIVSKKKTPDAITIRNCSFIITKRQIVEEEIAKITVNTNSPEANIVRKYLMNMDFPKFHKWVKNELNLQIEPIRKNTYIVKA